MVASFIIDGFMWGSPVPPRPPGEANAGEERAGGCEETTCLCLLEGLLLSWSSIQYGLLFSLFGNHYFSFFGNPYLQFLA